MSSWPSCDSFVGYDPLSFCNGPQDCKFKWATLVTFGKPAKIKQLKDNSIHKLFLSSFNKKDKVIQVISL